MRNLIFAAAADRDIDEIERYTLNEFGERRLAKIKASLQTAFHRIASSPLQFPVVAEHKRTYRRCIVSGTYAIYFYISNDTITVSRVYHGARSPLTKDDF